MSKEDGGPAFPGSFAGHCGNEDHQNPCGCYLDSGMTLRDYFAGQAMVGLIPMVGILGSGASGVTQNTSEIAYKIADEMLKARTK